MNTTATISLNFVWKMRLTLWEKGERLKAEGNRLWEEGNWLMSQGERPVEEGERLMAQGNWLVEEGDRLISEGNWLWEDAVAEVYGDVSIAWKSDRRCLIEGDEYTDL